MQTPVCSECREAVRPQEAVHGLCPSCLLQTAAGLSPPDTRPPGDTRIETPAPDRLAKQLPHLELLEVIGRGGMGIVYLARQKSVDRLIALKIIPRQSADNPELAERFHQEARVLAKLQHPQIVTAFNYGATDEFHYLEMEYIAGESLRRTIERGPSALDEALPIVLQVSAALAYAHDKGVVHRDITPENVLIRQGEQLQVSVVDFGLALLAQNDATSFRLTGDNHRMGTPFYMAPEQRCTPTNVDQRADIYAVGVLLYELLTGEPPAGNFSLPSQTAGTPAALDEIILRCLKQDPSARYPSIKALADDLQGAFVGRRSSKSIGRRIAIGVGVAAALLAVVAVFVYLTTNLSFLGIPTMSADSQVIQCPQCGKQYNFPSANIGKKVRCKQCDNIFVAAAHPPAAKPPVARPAPPRHAPAEEVAIDLAGKWTVMQGEYGGLPCFVRVNEALKPIAGRGHHSQSVTIAIHFDSAGPEGLPTDEDDLARVEATEQLLTETLQTAGESLCAVIVTTDGSRTMTFYSRDAQGAAKRFEAAIPQLPSRNVELSIEPDEQWSLYHQFVD